MVDHNTAPKPDDGLEDYYENFDKLFRSYANQYLGISPAFSLSVLDWLLHLSISPAKQMQLISSAFEKLIQLQQFHNNHLGDIENTKSVDRNRRFRASGWQNYPFNIYAEGFLLLEQFWKEAVDSVVGMSTQHKLVNHFIIRQWLNIMSPGNSPLTNPEVMAATEKYNGANFIQGWYNFLEDLPRKLSHLPPIGIENFKVGENMAITPGKVIFKNELIELIQYEPTTNEVYQDPILIVPACIMKYYILDLSEHNSLVKYLVSKGHTVFMISWKNATYQDSKLGFDDYINVGVMSAIDVVSNVVPNTQIHTVGYCLGGTMLSATAAYMAGKADNRIKTVTLLAAQIDFKDAGELLVFINEAQLLMLKDDMWKSGVLTGKQMADAFNIMHSHELIWGKMVQDYFIGERRPLFDVMAWNADTTRLPVKMHSEYLEKLFLKNQLIQGDFVVNGDGISLSNIDVPIFAVGTVSDHVAPWKSVYKIHFFTNVDLTFALTTGGHNVGIISQPGRKNRSYQIMTKKQQDKCIHQDAWVKKAPSKEGSWWLGWQDWLIEHSDTTKVNPPEMGNKTKGYKVLYPAPGKYIFDK